MLLCSRKNYFLDKKNLSVNYQLSFSREIIVTLLPKELINFALRNPQEFKERDKKTTGILTTIFIYQIAMHEGAPVEFCIV